MKKSFLTLLIATALLFLYSCEKEGVGTYTGPDNIYFTKAFGTWNLLGTFEPGADSQFVNFGWTSALTTDSLLPLAITISGSPVNSDREYSFRIDTGSTAKAGIHYELPTGKTVVKGGKVTDTFYLKIHRTTDMQVDTALLNILLVPNENFVTDFKYMTQGTRKYNLIRMRLKLLDQMSQPTYWGVNYWGKFTKKKFFLAVEVLGIPYNYFFTYAGQSVDQYNYTRMARYLTDKKAAGDTVYEDDGTEMKMGPFAY